LDRDIAERPQVAGLGDALVDLILGDRDLTIGRIAVRPVVGRVGRELVAASPTIGLMNRLLEIRKTTIATATVVARMPTATRHPPSGNLRRAGRESSGYSASRSDA
jgi:hypothetical protein